MICFRCYIIIGVLDSLFVVRHHFTYSFSIQSLFYQFVCLQPFYVQWTPKSTWPQGSCRSLRLCPILHTAQLTFYTDTCIISRRKADFPPQQTRATTLAPWEAFRRKAEACFGAKDTWYYLTDRKSSRATDRRRPGLNALADSAVGDAILTCLGRLEL